MKSWLVPWLVLPWVALGQRAGDETRAPFPEFKALLAKSGLVLPDRRVSGPNYGSRQFHLQWDGREMKVIAQQHLSAAARRKRAPRLEGDVILITAIDRMHQVRFWNVIPDPRVAHVEISEPGGELRGVRILRESANFLLALPDDPDIVEVRFAVPRPENGQSMLETLATLQLTEDR